VFDASGAQGEAKLALLRTLRSAGGPKALQIVKAAASKARFEIVVDDRGF